MIFKKTRRATIDKPDGQGVVATIESCNSNRKVRLQSSVDVDVVIGKSYQGEQGFCLFAAQPIHGLTIPSGETIFILQNDDFIGDSDFVEIVELSNV